jgi:hypothetical protein
MNILPTAKPVLRITLTKGIYIQNNRGTISSLQKAGYIAEKRKHTKIAALILNVININDEEEEVASKVTTNIKEPKLPPTKKSRSRRSVKKPINRKDYSSMIRK